MEGGVSSQSHKAVTCNSWSDFLSFYFLKIACGDDPCLCPDTASVIEVFNVSRCKQTHWCWHSDSDMQGLPEILRVSGRWPIYGCFMPFGFQPDPNINLFRIIHQVIVWYHLKATRPCTGVAGSCSCAGSFWHSPVQRMARGQKSSFS